jgi:hypothetical protein
MRLTQNEIVLIVIVVAAFVVGAAAKHYRTVHRGEARESTPAVRKTGTRPQAGRNDR